MLKRSKLKYNEFLKELDDWIEDLAYWDKAKRTLNAYRKSADIFKEFLIKNQPEQVTVITVKDFRDYLKKKKLSNNTINLRLKVVNRIFKDLGYSDIRVELLKDSTSNIAKDVITEEEFNLFIRTANKLGKKKMALIAETLAFTGMRISELEELTRGALRNRVFTVSNKGKERYIFIPKTLNNKLKRYCRDNKIRKTKDLDPVIFHGRELNRLIDQAYIRREFNIIAKATGLDNPERFHPHAFRHYFSFLYVTTPGTNPYWLSDILGHSTKGRATITDLYTRAGTKDYLKAVDLVEQTHRK